VNKGKVSDQLSCPTEIGNGSPGAILRRCREFHEITLEEASETTKIGVSHLKALEEDRIREFANQAYLKGFLRIYATYLGLNSDDIARMYGKLFGVQGEKPDSAPSPPTPVRPARRWISLKKMVFLALLLAAILITATFFKRPPPPLVRPQQPAVVVAPPVQDTAVQAVQSSAQVRKTEQEILPLPLPKVEKRPVVPPVSENVVAPNRPSDPPKGFILKIKVTQSGTLTSTVDGSDPQRHELAVGDVIVWKAEKNVTLELNDAGRVDIELNGKPYKSLGAPGTPVYVELDADGVKQ
jgi:cytoskeletal protein RodZ